MRTPFFPWHDTAKRSLWCPSESEHFVTLEQDQVNELLDTCMAFLTGKAIKAMRNTAVAGEPFRRMRMMMSRLTVQAHGYMSGLPSIRA